MGDRHYGRDNGDECDQNQQAPKRRLISAETSPGAAFGCRPRLLRGVSIYLATATAHVCYISAWISVVGGLLLGHEEPRISPVLSHAQRRRPCTPRTTTVVRGAGRVAVNTRVYAAAVKPYADPRARCRNVPAGCSTCGILEAFDIEMIWRRFVHQSSPAPTVTASGCCPPPRQPSSRPDSQAAALLASAREPTPEPTDPLLRAGLSPRCRLILGSGLSVVTLPIYRLVPSPSAR